MTDGGRRKIDTRIIAVAHQKGGTGKTVTACALAECFASLDAGLIVCVVDLDPQAACSRHLGGKPSYASGSYDAFVSGMALAEVAVKTPIKNCWLVPATPRLQLSEMDITSQPILFDAVARRLKEPTSPFDVIIIDCPSGLGLISTMAMSIADLVLIPTPPLSFATRAMGETISYLNRLRRDANDIVAILMTMVEQDNPLHTVMIKKLRRDCGALIAPFDIPQETCIEQGSMERRFLFDQFPSAASTWAYQKLAGNLAFRLGLISRLPVGRASAVHRDDRQDVRSGASVPAGDKMTEASPERLSSEPISVSENREEEPINAESNAGAELNMNLPPLPETFQQNMPDQTTHVVTKKSDSENPVQAIDSDEKKVPKWTKILISIILAVVTIVVIYVGVKTQMLAWVMLAYLVLILAFFPILIFLLI